MINTIYQCDSCEMHFHSEEQYQEHKKREAKQKRMDELMLQFAETDGKWSAEIMDSIRQKK